MNILVEVLENKRDNMFCSVEHRNPWVTYGHNISGTMYVGSTIEQYKCHNSYIGLPLGVTFIKVLDYRKEKLFNIGGILIISFFTISIAIDNVEHNKLAI